MSRTSELRVSHSTVKITIRPYYYPHCKSNPGSHKPASPNHPVQLHIRKKAYSQFQFEILKILKFWKFRKFWFFSKNQNFDFSRKNRNFEIFNFGLTFQWFFFENVLVQKIRMSKFLKKIVLKDFKKMIRIFLTIWNMPLVLKKHT